MTILLIVLAVLPWSIWRQMHPRPVTVSGLTKLPLILAGVAALIALTSPAPVITAEVVAYYAACAALAIGFGAWRGRRVSIWHDGSTPMQRGNRATLLTWAAMITLKVALGTVAATTGRIPAEGAAAILGFLALTFAVQSLVVARRALPGRMPSAVLATGRAGR
jgi:hypothetical protein